MKKNNNNHRSKNNRIRLLYFKGDDKAYVVNSKSSALPETINKESFPKLMLKHIEEQDPNYSNRSQETTLHAKEKKPPEPNESSVQAQAEPLSSINGYNSSYSSPNAQYESNRQQISTNSDNNGEEQNSIENLDYSFNFDLYVDFNDSNNIDWDLDFDPPSLL